MPRHEPLPNWSGEDVYVLGGGSSLRGFDFNQLKDKKVIGCNQAFLLGGGVVDICTFGDEPFWTAFKEDIEAHFGGWVVTNYWIQPAPPWLHVFDRVDEGLAGSHHHALAWNGNTGCSAANLALKLGAARILLLGFDCHGGDGTHTHWHDQSLGIQTPSHYKKFCDGFAMVRRMYPDIYPGAHIYNVHDGDSELKCFPALSFEMLGMLGPSHVHSGGVL